MRFKILSFSFFILFLLLITIMVYANADYEDNTLPLLHKVIFIDPGHGGRDAGTVYGKVLEKDINLAISHVLRKQLGEKGAIVYMTRESDVDLSSKYDTRKKRGDLYRRVKMISNKSLQADLYLSIHINWYDNSYWGGAEVLYNKINPQNKILGNILMKNFQSDLGTKRSLKETYLYMYKNITVPGVLIECGFLSNSRERYLLQTNSYHEKIARSITKSVIEYFLQHQ